MNTKTIYLTTILYAILSLNNSWARKPIIPDEATMRKIHQEISKTVQAKEYNSTEDLSLYSCYGKIYFKDHNTEITGQITRELENSGITIERIKVNQKTNQSYLIFSMVTHDSQELKRLIAKIFGGAEYNTSRSNTQLQAGLLVARNLGCTELPLK